MTFHQLVVRHTTFSDRFGQRFNGEFCSDEEDNDFKCDVSRLDFTSIPEDAFTQIGRLDELYMFHTKLSTIPENVFVPLGRLLYLGLSGNRFLLPSNVFAPLGNLKTLFLHDNGLTTLPDNIFASLLNLECLFLEENLLTSLPTSLTTLYRLKTLNVKKNPLFSCRLSETHWFEPRYVYDSLIECQNYLRDIQKGNEQSKVYRCYSHSFPQLMIGLNCCANSFSCITLCWS